MAAALTVAASLSPGHADETAGDPVIVAAGDIACDANSSEATDTCAQRPVADLLGTQPYTAILPLGDNQYDTGQLSDYLAAYDATWGRFKAITRPIPGNHECDYDPLCAGYYAYFGYPPPFYSYNLGTWHLIALNGECAVVGGCDALSPQGVWLAADLLANPNRCVLAYWHEPRWSSGVVHGSDGTYDDFWQILYSARAAVVLNGHEHNYERFAPMRPDGSPAPDGIRQFVVGTGGKEHYPLGEPLYTSEVRDSTTFGVLKLGLHDGWYDWEFVNAPSTGAFTDSGRANCPTRPPTGEGLARR
jgi:acid phosphatase type 7